MENTPSYSAEIELTYQDDVTEHLLEKYNAERIIWTDQTSSAGSWSGLIVKKVGEDLFDLIEFSQEIHFGDGQKTVWVGENITKYPVSEDSFDAVLEMYYDMYFDCGSSYDDFEEDDYKPSKRNEGHNTMTMSFDD